MGPVWSTKISIGMMPVYGTSPHVGFIPYTPQYDAGIRIEPPWSPPIAMSTSPAATNAALPEEDARRETHLARIVYRSGGVGMASAGEAETLAMRLADDL